MSDVVITKRMPNIDSAPSVSTIKEELRIILRQDFDKVCFDPVRTNVFTGRIKTAFLNSVVNVEGAIEVRDDYNATEVMMTARSKFNWSFWSILVMAAIFLIWRNYFFLIISFCIDVWLWYSQKNKTETALRNAMEQLEWKIMRNTVQDKAKPDWFPSNILTQETDIPKASVTSYCVYCGAKMKSDQKYCPSCGAPKK